MSLPFSMNYCWGKSTVGQIMRGLAQIKENVIAGQPNDMTPHIVYVIDSLMMAYNHEFLDVAQTPLQKQVFGANLNGRYNNGQLYKYIFPRTNRRQRSGTRYNNTKIIHLLQLLKYRVRYIVNRDASQIKRYQENPDELREFQLLQQKANQFMKILSTGIIPYWKTSLKTVIKTKKQNTN